MKSNLKMLLTLLLVGVTVVNVVGCSGKESNKTDSPMDNVKVDNKYTKEDFDIDWEHWGTLATDKVPNEKNEKQDIEIRFPEGTGGWSKEGSGLVGGHDGHQWVIWDSYTYGGGIGYTSEDVKDDKLENVTTSYIKQFKGTIRAAFSVYDNFEWVIDTTEMVDINEYEMCRQTGTLKMTLGDENEDSKFVSYATKLKGNDAYVYFVILDRTDDQSRGQDMLDDALKMAITLKEIN